jgi:uroporphyrinogen-III decarboxylase
MAVSMWGKQYKVYICACYSLGFERAMELIIYGAELFIYIVEKIRKVFGRKRCLFGNLDSELLLLRNDTKEIKQKVEEQILQSGKNAPFIFNTGSPIPSDVQPEAVDTFISQIREPRAR